ncbi:hypothetical protein D0962_12535 [Leptolyngbyaceae cyanobacterium CCMR0082]|uniref:Nucleotidyltransferase family protein n=1 Tax=Adonisia turfae CCMR0082 TaxID=2304604 RepID=A0A6M0S507_9CYAN|nr:hypothetical protein [Adonisia turfae CCMR0082]
MHSPQITHLLSYLNQTVTSAALESPQWPALFHLSQRHGVLLRLYHTLPHSLQCPLQQTAQSLTVYNWQLARTLTHLLSTFHQANILVLPCKGPTLALTLHGDLSRRTYCDLDLLVDGTDAEAAQSLLLAQGYCLRDRTPWGSDFTAPNGQFSIDLHWQIAPPCFSYRLDLAALHQRCRPLPYLGTTLPTLSPEDHFLILCVQIVKDSYFDRLRLSQFCDLADLMPKLAPEQVLTLAGNNLRLVHCALQLTHRFIPLTLPSPLQEDHASYSDPIANRHIDQVAATLFTERDPHQGIFSILQSNPISSIKQACLRVLLLCQHPHRPSWTDLRLLTHVVGYALTPNSRDRTWLSPHFSHWGLSYLARPLRLLHKLIQMLMPRLYPSAHTPPPTPSSAEH